MHDSHEEQILNAAMTFAAALDEGLPPAVVRSAHDRLIQATLDAYSGAGWKVEARRGPGPILAP
jgi:hypothetical protein